MRLSYKLFDWQWLTATKNRQYFQHPFRVANLLVHNSNPKGYRTVCRLFLRYVPSLDHTNHPRPNNQEKYLFLKFKSTRHIYSNGFF